MPIQALIRHGDQATVFRVGGDNRIEERPVTLGLETPAEVEVLSGLNEGDLVVISGQGQLRPGQKVKPRVTEAPAIREES